MAGKTGTKKGTTKRKRLNPKVLWKIIKDTANGFREDNVSRLSASLAYATLFSIIPLFSLLITIGGYLRMDIGAQLYTQLGTIVGQEVVAELKTIIEKAVKVESISFAGIISLAAAIFGATAIFAEIQNSLNTIWGIKAVPKQSWLKYIKNRLLSFSIILIFAFILLVTFAISNVISDLRVKFIQNYPEITETFIKIGGFVMNFVVTVTIFVLIYKILPDAKIKTKDVLIGAIVTTLLFLAGQWAISFYLGIANVGTVYGAAAFMAIIVTWLYYSAFIIYIGAEFTEAWTLDMGGRIIPDEFAVATKVVEIHESENGGSPEVSEPTESSAESIAEDAGE